MRRRITVQFGSTRVVVPCGDGRLTLQELTQEAIERYKNVTGKESVRVKRLQLPEDEAFLDMRDRLDDVLDEGCSHIVAIVDDEERIASTSSEVTSCDGRGARIWRNSVVEVNDLHSIPMGDLRVSSSRSVHSSLKDVPLCTPVRSSLRSDTITSPTRNHRVTLSPEVTRKLDAAERVEGPRLARSTARKSKMSESFYDARERLEEERDSRDFPSSISVPSSLSNAMSPIPLSSAHTRSISSHSSCVVLPGTDESQCVFILHDTEKTPIGITVTAVMDEHRSGKMVSLQIMHIESDGRVGRDGRLRVGDNVLELDGRPVYQMSLLRAQTLLLELANKPSPTLTIARPLSSFDTPSIGLDGMKTRPIQSALQQANTAEIVGERMKVEIRKKNGFGFTITGRDTAAGRHLFLIGTVKNGGAAMGILQSGDRLLEVNGENTENMRQNEVVDTLKRIGEGGRVRLIVTRVGGLNEKDKDKENLPEVESGWEELTLSIPLNNTGSAGLGVSLKARVTVKNDGSRHDCGIFVKKLLHGGAAYKDGRLRVDDRLVAIEDVHLRTMARNAEASEAITGKLKQIGQHASCVTLKVWRPLSSSPTSSSHTTIIQGRDDIHDHPTTPITMSSDHSENGGQISRECSADEDNRPNGIDPFDREAPMRKSMSEKRGMGASSDATLTNTFQKIKHNRQTSAPPPSASFHGASAVAKRTAERVRSHSVHPRVPNEGNEEEEKEEGQNSTGGEGERRKVQRGIPVSHSFRQAINDSGTVGAPWVYQSATDSPLIGRKQNGQREKEKERRKSMGSGLLSIFKIGKSRDGSPEKKELRRREDDGMRRLDGDVTPSSHRKHVYSQFSPSHHFNEASSPSFVVANSKFYSSFSSSHHTPTSSTDTSHIGMRKGVWPHPLSTHPPINQWHPSTVIPFMPQGREGHPTTTMHSMHGLHTVERVEDGPVHTRGRVVPPSIAFPTTRFPVYPVGTALRQSKERLSLRARKKLREGREMRVEREEIPPPEGVDIPVIRMRRDGTSLPSRHLIHPVQRTPIHTHLYSPSHVSRL